MRDIDLDVPAAATCRTGASTRSSSLHLLKGFIRGIAAAVIEWWR